MPMAFASLLGGIDDADRHLAQHHRRRACAQELTRRALRHVRLHAGRRSGIAAAGLVFLRFGWRLLPAAARARPALGEAHRHRGLHDRGARSPRTPPMAGQTVSELRKLDEERGDGHRHRARRLRRSRRCRTWCCGRTTSLHAARASRRHSKRGRPARSSSWTARIAPPREDDPKDEIGVIEAVIGAELAADRPRRPGAWRCTTASASTCSRSAAAASASRERLRDIELRARRRHRRCRASCATCPTRCASSLPAAGRARLALGSAAAA